MITPCASWWVVEGMEHFHAILTVPNSGRQYRVRSQVTLCHFGRKIGGGEISNPNLHIIFLSSIFLPNLLAIREDGA